MLQSFWMLLAAFLFAVMGAFVKTSSAEVGTFEIVFYRSLMGLLVIWTIIALRGETIRTKHLGGHLKRSILGTISFTMWFASMAHLPLGTSTTFQYTAPLFIAAATIVSCLMKKQKAPWLLGLAICVGFAGVCLVLQPSIESDQLGWAMVGLAAGAMGPIIFFQIKQLGQLKEPSLRIVFYFSLVGTVWGLGGAFLMEGGLHFHANEIWLGLLGVGSAAVIAQMCMTRAFAYGHMLLTACFQFMTIPFAELISVYVFGEHLPVSALVGMGLILVAGSSASVITKKMEAEKARQAQAQRLAEVIASKN